MNMRLLIHAFLLLIFNTIKTKNLPTIPPSSPIAVQYK